MKKATKSVTTPATPAPEPAPAKKAATKTPAPAAPTEPAPAKKKAPPRKKSGDTTPPVRPPVIPASAPTAPAPAPVAKAPARAVVVTTIAAKIDVGFGNALYIRGEGPGLSWERGALLDCVADDRWQHTLSDAQRPIVFKFLLNDLTWSIGEDYAINPGATTVFTPAF